VARADQGRAQPDELLKASPFGYVPEGPMVLAVDHELQERFLAAARDNPFIQTI
jgi:hypothetical protein